MCTASGVLALAKLQSEGCLHDKDVPKIENAVKMMPLLQIENHQKCCIMHARPVSGDVNV